MKMPSRLSNNLAYVWRLMGLGSSIIGFTCFALGPSFQNLFGRWNLLKIIMYCVLSSMFSFFMLFANHFRRRFPRVFLFKTLVSFLVLLSTSLYSYYDDRGNKDGETEGKGHRSILSLISFGSFALMSMSLSAQVQPGFEVGMSSFFLGYLVLGVMKKNFLEGLGVAVLCVVVMSLRSYSDSRPDILEGLADELRGIIVVGETPQILTPLPLTTHPSPSLSTLRHRNVNLESSSKHLTPLKVIEALNHRKSLEARIVMGMPFSFNALNDISFSLTEWSTLSRSEWNDFIKALRHATHLNLRSPESSRGLIPTYGLRWLQLIGACR